MAQKYSSKSTATNGKQGKLPSLYSKITFPNGIVIDYGCGDVTDKMKEKAEKDGATWYGYDLYNQTSEVNEETMSILNNGVDLSIACNLLNVIDDENEIREIINRLVSNSKEIIFQIYAGDGTNIGKRTGEDSYQRNAETSWYENLIKEMGYTVTKANKKFIYVKGEKINEESI